MNRWIIATAALGAMAMPVFGQNAADNAKRDADKPKEAPRITLDLPGAPLTPRQVQVFVDDAQPGAIDRLVENALVGPPAPGVIPTARPAGKKEKVTYLGVVTSTAAPAMREQLKLPKGVGLVVDSVEARTAAETAGVKQHDVIEKLNDQLLVNTEQFTALLRSMKAGDEVTLTLIRQGERQSLKARLGEKEIDAGATLKFNFTPPAALQAPLALGDGVLVMGDGAQAGNVAWSTAINAMVATPQRGMRNVTIQLINGKQTTDWADDQFRISLERDGDKITKVTVADAKTGKLMFTGTPPGPNDPVFKTLPQLLDKLKRAEAAATAQPPFVVDGLIPPTGGRGKVVRWQDADHVLMMRVIGNKPLYLLALSKKDGRTLYDGPVMTDEQRKSLPAEVSEQFELLATHPEEIKEFGAAEPKK